MSDPRVDLIMHKPPTGTPEAVAFAMWKAVVERSLNPTYFDPLLEDETEYYKTRRLDHENHQSR